MTLLEKLSNKYNFTERESMIADFILTHCEDVLKMTTRELATQTYTSATVIVRFTQKLGYKGFNEFKLHLLSDLKENSFQEITFTKEDSLIALANKVSSLHEKALLETKNMLSIKDLQKIQNAIKETKQVDIFALDANASLGDYLSHNIMQAGKISNVYQSIDKILMYESLIKDSVVIIISRMGKDKHIHKAIRRLRQNGHFVIAITSNKDSLLAKNSDVSLLCAYKENITELGDALFHTSVSYLFDIIVSIIINQNYDTARNLYHLHDHLYEY